jgi:putative transposase
MAVLDRASRGWRGVNTTPDGLRLLHDLRRCLLEPPPQIHPRTPATDSAAENVRATA